MKIGRRSSGVMVTGGDDKNVNMWAIGKPHAIVVRLPAGALNNGKRKRTGLCLAAAHAARLGCSHAPRRRAHVRARAGLTRRVRRA